MASTCPWTKCPPKRPSARSGRSRFTRLPRSNAPSVVTRSVSGPTSACTSLPSARITVRQTPLTARLSPGASSGASDATIRSRMPAVVGLTSATSPTLSTRPVNISFDQSIRPDRLGARIDQFQRGERPPLEQGHAAGSEHVRRNVEAHEIDEIFVPRGSVHRGAAFQQDRFYAAGPQPFERRAEGAVRRHIDLHATILERPP